MPLNLRRAYFLPRDSDSEDYFDRGPHQYLHLGFMPQTYSKIKKILHLDLLHHSWRRILKTKNVFILISYTVHIECLASRVWPAGRSLPTTALKTNYFVNLQL